MPESLGEKLRQAREERGISISEVSEQTRISSLYLQSIENDDYRTLPGGIFNKGFVKSFAKYVGIDEHEALDDYARLMNTQQPDEDVNEPKTYRPQVLTDDSNSSSMLPTIIFAVIILGLMTWGIIFLVNWWQNQQSSIAGDDSLSNNNVKVEESTNTNQNANVNGANNANQTLPAMDSIKVVVTTSEPELAIQSTIDGKTEVRSINAEVKEQTFEAEESLKLNYYKGLAQTVQLTINGKKIETPIPPPTYKKNGFEFEINKNNLKEILQSGKIPLGEAANADANTQTNANAIANTSANTATQ